MSLDIGASWTCSIRSSILQLRGVKARFEAAGEATERCPESYRGGGFPATIRLALSLTRRRPCDVCGTPAREVSSKTPFTCSSTSHTEEPAGSQSPEWVSAGSFTG